MTPYLQFRIWLRDATGPERSMAVLMLLVVIAVIAWGVAPDRGDDVLGVASSPVPIAPAANGSSATTAPEASTEPGAAPAEAASLPGAAPSSGNGAPTSAGTSTETSSSAVGDAPLTASDRGVTPSSVKVGFTILSLAGANDAGIAADLRTDISEVIDAVVDHYNDAGGILSRAIKPVKVRVDIINTDDQRAKCLHLTETEKVFAVVDTIQYVFRPARACFTIEHQTPLVSFIPGGADEVAQSYPLLASPTKDYSRVMVDYVRSAKDAGFFDPAKGFRKLGLLTDDCDPKVIDDGVGLKAQLRAVGVTQWSEFRVGCSVDEQQREPPQAAIQHRSDGVTHVMFVTTHVAIEPYMRTATAQLYRPKYWMSDYEGVTMDIASNKLPPDQADRVRGVSQHHSGDPMKVAAARACSKILTDRGLKPITSFNRDFEALSICENSELFVRAAVAAGPNLTRHTWGAGVQRIGTLAGTITNVARFANRKMTGGDTIATVEWRRECSCWNRVDEFRPAYG